MLLHVGVVARANMLAHTRLFRIVFYLIVAICLFSGLFWLVEKPYRSPEEAFTLVDAMKAILVFTLSGFDADPPHTVWGWAFAILSLMFGVMFVGIFTAEIASIFVESRIKSHSAVKHVIFKNHVLVCGDLSDADYFFEQLFHPDHGAHDLQLVFLMQKEPSPVIESILSQKKYKYRVKYIIGTPLIQRDLQRANAEFARAAFIFADRFSQDPDKEDANTILRTLAIRAYSEKMTTYVQLLKAKNKIHLQATGAENFICVEELTLNLIAQSSINPGLTDLIANLVNTSDDVVLDDAPEWVQEHAEGVGKEIYRIPAGLCCYGRSFAEVASGIYHVYGMTVIAMQRLGDDEEYTLAVNPGYEWDVNPGDYLFVISDDYEKAIELSHHEEDLIVATALDTSDADEKDEEESGWKGDVIPRDKAIIEHVEFGDHIVICGAGKDLPMLINPLRSPDLQTYQRIVILNTIPLTPKEWKAIEHHPEIYFVEGSPLNYNDLLHAGMATASKALILNSYESIGTGDPILVDADVVMTVMGIQSINPDVYTIAELMYSSNIHFIAPDETDEHHTLPFSVNEVVTVSRIADALIAQSYYTPGFIEIFQELFSVDVHDEEEERNTCEVYQSPVPKEYVGRKYEELFHFLAVQHGIIPVGLYRTREDGKRYVYCTPDKETELRDDDRIYVFAPDEPELE